MADVTRGEINDIIANFATKSNDYREKLLASPKTVLSKQMNQDLSLQLRLARADYELASKRLEDASIVAPILPALGLDEPFLKTMTV